jgi:hypothetical protein
MFLVYIVNVYFFGLNKTAPYYNQRGVMTKNTTKGRKRGYKRGSKRVYTRKHFSSNDGMLTTVWGPSMWHVLHTISFNYPVKPSCNDKQKYREFVLNLVNVLPCGKCRENLHKNFAKLPLHMSDMKSRDTFSRYMYRLHELINRMLGKKSGLSYQDVRERYEHFRARCATPASPDVVVTTLEKGCTEPLVGEKSKCVLHIVPQTQKCETFRMDKRCIKRRSNKNQ